MFEREKRVLARHYLDEGMSRAEAARRVGIGRRTLYNWIADGLLEGHLGDQTGWIRFRGGSPSVEAGSVQGDHPDAAGRVSRAERGASVRGGAGGGLPRRVRPGEAARSGGPPAGARGAAGAVRDAAGASGPGGLRGVRAALGQAVRADGRAGVLPADVAAVLRTPDHGGGHPRARGVVRILRRGSGGDAVRPDEGGGARRRAELGRAPG